MSNWYVLYFDATAKRDMISKRLQTLEEAHAFACLLERVDCAILDVLEVPDELAPTGGRSDAFELALKAVRASE